MNRFLTIVTCVFALLAGATRNGAGAESTAKATIAELRKVVSRNPQSAEAHTELGTALGEKGDVLSAIQELQKAVQINPDLANAHYNLGTTWIKKAKQAEALKT